MSLFGKSVLLLSLLLMWGGISMAVVVEDVTLDKVRALYGVNPNGPPLEGKTPEEKAQFIKGLGANAVFGGYKDEEFVKACKAEGIAVYASLGLFQGEGHWNSDPGGRPINSKGEPIEKEEWYSGVCPTHEKIREDKLNDIKSHAKKGLVDGIWLDFIRYPIHWEYTPPKLNLQDTCFCQRCLTKFQKDTGLDLGERVTSATEAASFLLGEQSEKWYRWRCQQITDFVAEAAKALHERNPDAKLGMFSVPWLPKDYDNAIYRIVGQDFESLAPHVDVFSPMVYHHLCERKPEWVAEVTAYMAKATGKPVWPITQAFNEPGVMEQDEFAESVEHGFKEPSGGVILFSFGHIVKEERLEGVRTVFGVGEGEE